MTDVGQSQHFEMVFKAARASNLLTESTELRHVPFGLVQGEDGKKFKTRSGDTVRLKDLLDQAVSTAEEDMLARLNSGGKGEGSAEPVEEGKLVELSAENKAVARIVGIGAVKYADLSMNRESNYRFSYRKMLSLTGNTAPYMLYAFARIQGANAAGGKGMVAEQIDNLSLALKSKTDLLKPGNEYKLGAFLERQNIAPGMKDLSTLMGNRDTAPMVLKALRQGTQGDTAEIEKALPKLSTARSPSTKTEPAKPHPGVAARNSSARFFDQRIVPFAAS